MDGRGGGRRRRGIGRGRSIFSRGIDETQSIALELAKKLTPGDVVCLEGDLGAGKTTFVKALASHFGIREQDVSSPTFVYMNQYDPIVHFDLYRLKTEEEFFGLGLDEYISPPYIICIEWPNILEKALPKEVYWVSLKHKGEGRMITVEKRVR